MSILPLLGSGIGLGAAGASLIRGSDKSTLRGLEEAREAARGLEVLDEQALAYKLQTLKNMGQLTPEMEQEILQEASGMRHISTDPALRQAQMEALTRLERQGKEGLTLEERAAQEEIQRGIQTENRMAQEAVMQNMAARGQLGAGSELAQRLQASQSAADSARQEGSNLARLMAARRLEAAMNAGQLGGSIREQDFGEQAKKAEAQDAINRFNTQSRQNVQAANVGAKNLAARYNLDYLKDLEANRVNTANEQAKINADAYARALASRNQRRTGIADVGREIGQAKDRQFANRIAATQQIGSTVGALGMGANKTPSGQLPVDAAGGTTQYSRDYLKS